MEMHVYIYMFYTFVCMYLYIYILDTCIDYNIMSIIWKHGMEIWYANMENI